MSAAEAGAFASGIRRRGGVVVFTNGVPYDYHRLLYTFRVTSPVNDVGIFRPRHRWHFSGGVRLSGPE